MGAGAAGTVYRVKHKAEGGEVVFSIQLDLYDFLLCIFVFVGGFYLYLCVFVLCICVFSILYLWFLYMYQHSTRDKVWMEIGLSTINCLKNMKITIYMSNN